jgi:PAS domain S-box-containing protein
MGPDQDEIVSPRDEAERVFPPSGEMGERCRAMDWSATPLGPVEEWPQSLRTAAGMVVAQGIAQNLCWGPELIQIYNDAYARMMGAKHPAGLGRSVLDSWVEVAAEIGPLFQRALAGETVTFEDLRLEVQRHGEPEETYFTFSYSPVRTGTGEVGGVLVTSIETTATVHARALQEERDRLLAELQVEQARLEYVFQQAPAFLAVLRGREHTFELINEAYSRLIGHRQVVGRPVREALPEVVGQGFLDLLTRVMETGEPYVGREVAVHLVRTPGAEAEERFVDFSYLPLIEADGTRSGVIAHGTDVTDHVLARREAERVSQQLRTSEARFRAVFEHAPLGVGRVRFDDARWLDANDALARMVGLSIEEMRRTPWPDITHPDDLDLDLIPFRCMAAGELDRYNVEKRFIHSGGHDVWARLTLSLVRDEEGRPDYEIAVVEDITAQKEAEAERERLLLSEREARAEAEDANRAKADFLASMSHELRTPLNAIGGYIELLDIGVHGELSDPQREALARVAANQQHLLALINDVLAFAKLEAGQVEFNTAPITACDLLASVEPLVSPLSQAKGITLTAEACDGSIRLLGDEERVRQILLNLVGNAIKFTPQGGWVKLSAERDGGWVNLHVQDNGAGISPEQQRRVFEPFVQVNRRLSRPQEGVGLGLAISRDLARAMGGELTLESREGKGSTFTLRLTGA